MQGAPAEGGLERDLSEGEWLLNPGGVGQPRDGDPRAAWLLLDTEAWSAQWRRVEYPIDEAARAIEAAGLPQGARPTGSTPDSETSHNHNRAARRSRPDSPRAAAPTTRRASRSRPPRPQQLAGSPRRGGEPLRVRRRRLRRHHRTTPSPAVDAIIDVAARRTSTRTCATPCAQGFDRLFELSAEQCDEREGAQTETEPEPAPETETDADRDHPDRDRRHRRPTTRRRFRPETDGPEPRRRSLARATTATTARAARRRCPGTTGEPARGDRRPLPHRAAASARAACRRSSWPPTRCSSGRWRSSCSPSTWPRTRTSSPAFAARRCPPPGCSIRTSSRCSTRARIRRASRHYIVMEYVDGPSCADLLREHKRLEVERDRADRARRLPRARLRAPRRASSTATSSPGNLLIAQETHTTKLADFGIAKAAEQTRITQVGSVLGTAAYLSPEQAHGEEAGPASDIYSLGVCAYQFLTGRLPHEYSSLTELALKQQQDPVTPITELRPEVPPELDEAIRLCLERDPDSRYRSALELAQALEAGLRGESTEATRRIALDDDLTPPARWGRDRLHTRDAAHLVRACGPRRRPRNSAETAPPPCPRRPPRGGAGGAPPPHGAPSSRCCWWWPRSPRWAWPFWPRATAVADVQAPDASEVEQQIRGAAGLHPGEHALAARAAPRSDQRSAGNSAARLHARDRVRDLLAADVAEHVARGPSSHPPPTVRAGPVPRPRKAVRPRCSPPPPPSGG